MKLTILPPALALGAALALGIAPPAAAQSSMPIGQLSPGGVAIEGVVAEVFGNRFVLRDDSGRVLVSAEPERHHRLDIRAGERLRVTGKPDDGGFDAFTIRREDGREIFVRNPEGPPPWAGRGGPGPRHAEGRPGPRGGRPHQQAEIVPADQARRAAEAAGYRVTGAPERGPRHWDVPATNPRGEAVVVHVDAEGRVTRERWVRAN